MRVLRLLVRKSKKLVRRLPIPHEVPQLVPILPRPSAPLTLRQRGARVTLVLLPRHLNFFILLRFTVEY